MWVRLSLGVLCFVCLFALAGDAQIPVTVTAYSPGDSGWITASGKRAVPGMLAVSRDVERLLGLHFGQTVYLDGRPYQFEDRMAAYWRKRVDIRMATHTQAKHFGKRHAVLARGD